MKIIYKYIRGRQNNPESVEIEFFKGGKLTTVCTVDAYRLTIGIRTHPCTNGEILTVDDEMALSILRYIRDERNAVKYSGELKTLAEWQDCGLNLNDFVAVGDKVDNALADEQMNCLPPLIMKHGYFQVGEPYNQEQDESGKWRSTWATFVQNGPNWTYCGLCFANDTVNRVKERDRAAEAIRTIEIQRKGQQNE